MYRRLLMSSAITASLSEGKTWLLYMKAHEFNLVYASFIVCFVPLILQNKLNIYPLNLLFLPSKKPIFPIDRWSVSFKIWVCIVCVNNMKV